MRVKTKRRICEAVAVIAFILPVAMIDGLDRGIISPGGFLISFVICELVSIFSFYKDGDFRRNNDVKLF